MAWDTLDRFTVCIQWKALGTQSYALIQLHVISDDARLPNYHTRSVVYGEVAADGGTRVNIDSCFAG